METLFFYLFAFILLLSSLLVITRKNPVISIIFLCVALVTMAGLFVMLHAHFIAAIQIIVYAGAIMVLFLFVVMLLSSGKTKPPYFIKSPVRSLAILLVVLLLVEVGFVMWSSSTAMGPSFGNVSDSMGTTEEIGRVLFTRYLFPFEIASILLLVAMIGAIVLSKGSLK